MSVSASMLIRSLVHVHARPSPGAVLERATSKRLLKISRAPNAAEIEQAFLRARELCRRAGEIRELFPAMWNLWFFYHYGTDHAAAPDELSSLAEQAQEPDLLLQAHHAQWTTRARPGATRSVELTPWTRGTSWC